MTKPIKGLVVLAQVDNPQEVLFPRLLWCLHGFQAKHSEPRLLVSFPKCGQGDKKSLIKEIPSRFGLGDEMLVFGDPEVLEAFVESLAVQGILAECTWLVKDINRPESLPLFKRNYQAPRISKLLQNPEKIRFNAEETSDVSIFHRVAQSRGLPIGLVLEMNRLSVKLLKLMERLHCLGMRSQSSKQSFQILLELSDIGYQEGLNVSSYGMVVQTPNKTNN